MTSNIVIILPYFTHIVILWRTIRSQDKYLPSPRPLCGRKRCVMRQVTALMTDPISLLAVVSFPRRGALLPFVLCSPQFSRDRKAKNAPSERKTCHSPVSFTIQNQLSLQTSSLQVSVVLKRTIGFRD